MGTTERRARERKERRGAILDAAEKVFRARGVDKATMDEVAELCELAKGTLYRYFASKDDLYLGLAARGIRALREMLEEAASPDDNGLEAVRRAVSTYARFCRERPMYFSAFCFFNSAELRFEDPSESLKECADGYAEVLAHVGGLIEKGRADGSVKAQDRPDLAVALLSMTTTGYLSMLQKREAYLERIFAGEDFVERFADLITDALRP